MKNTDKKIDNYKKYVELNKRLGPIIKLQQKIQLFNVSWNNLNDTLNSYAKVIYDKDTPKADPYLSKQVELLIRSFLASISETRDIIERNFYKQKSGPACNNVSCKRSKKEYIYELAPKYNIYEENHQNLLKKSIFATQSEDWSWLLRNKILHGGTFNIIFLASQKSNGKTYTHKVDLMTEFGAIKEDDSFKNLDSDKYYTDVTIFSMTQVSKGEAVWDGYDPLSLKPKRQDIILRAKELNITLVHSDPLDNLYLLSNRDFVTLPYYTHKKKNLHLISKFGFFNLTELLQEIYSNFNYYYQNLYNLICYAENDNIKLLMGLSDQIMKNPHDMIEFIPPNFSLDIVKSEILSLKL